MTEKFDALIWRAQEPDIHGDIFTGEALAQMLGELRPGTDIFLDFDFREVVGHVDSAQVDGHDLRVTATFDDIRLSRMLQRDELAVRPGFSIEESHLDEEGRQVIDRVGMVYVSVTPNPMPLPGERQCILCVAPIPNDGGIDVCGRCIAERQS